MTGLGAVAGAAGDQMLSVRQSSDPTVLPSVVPMLSSWRLFRPGPYSRPVWTQAGPKAVADRGSVQARASRGARHLRSATGALA